MDRYDEKLVKWFDDEFSPFVVKEHYFAEKMARQKGMGQCRAYWEGYFEAFDGVYRLAKDAIDRIRDEVDKEKENEEGIDDDD